jgi:hypothetical protein
MTGLKGPAGAGQQTCGDWVREGFSIPAPVPCFSHIFRDRVFMEAGGLLSYGVNFTDQFCRGAAYVVSAQADPSGDNGRGFQTQRTGVDLKSEPGTAKA